MKVRRVIPFNVGSQSNDIRVLDNYASDNPFFWNWYILIVEYIEVTTFLEATDFSLV